MPYRGGRDTEMWVGAVEILFGIRKRLTQEYTELNLITPLKHTKARGGRNIYGPSEIVQLLMAKRLVEDGMLISEVEKVMNWLLSTSVKVVRYPQDPETLNWYEDSGEFKWISGDPRAEQDWWWPELLLSPFPDEEVASSYFNKVRGYPELPQTDREWVSYWNSMVQLIVLRYQTGLSAISVAIPKRWISAEPGHFRRVLKWLNQVTGVTAEPVLRGGDDPLSTIRIIDVAKLKRLVAGKLLGPPEEVEGTTDE